MKPGLFFSVFAVFAGIMLSGGCSDKYDDAALWEKVNGMDARLKELEQKCDRMNTNILSLQTLVTALQGRDYITVVNKILQGDKVIGYTISFSLSDPVTIYHGVDGTDGSTPVISVKQDADGIWYWTVDGEWLLADGKKVKAEAQDGSNGVTPRFKIEEGYWFVSYDNEKTWTKLGKAVGETGLSGEDGDNFFDGVDIQDGYVVFTLNNEDKTKIKLPYYKEGKLVLNSEYEGHVRVLLTDEICRSIIDLSVTGILSPGDVAYLAKRMLSLEVLDLSGTNLPSVPAWCFCRGTLKSGMISLREVILPETCTVLESGAFYGCINLRKIVAVNAKANGATSTVFTYTEDLRYVSIGNCPRGFSNAHVQHLDWKGDVFYHDDDHKNQIDTLICKYTPREESGRVYLRGYGCHYVAFDEDFDKDIPKISISYVPELILPVSLKDIGYIDLGGSFDTVVVKSNASLDSYSHGSQIKAFYWYPNRLPGTLINQYPSVNKIDAFYVPQALLSQFKAKWSGFNFLPLEDSDYYKTHPYL